MFYCTGCGFAGDRDMVACINLFLRYSRCGALGIALNAPKPDENLRGMRGKQDEAVKLISTHMNHHKS